MTDCVSQLLWVSGGVMSLGLSIIGFKAMQSLKYSSQAVKKNNSIKKMINISQYIVAIYCHV